MMYHLTNRTQIGTQAMDIKLQGRLTDYITDKLSAKYPEIIPDDLT